MPYESRAEHGTTSRYRAGCRCTSCRRAHSQDTYRYRTPRSAEFTAAERRKIVRSLRRGDDLTAIAEELGVPWQRITALARNDDQVRAALDGEQMS